jgi:anti-sigma factor (TIGR02949 family)
MVIHLVDCSPCADMIRRLDEYVDRALSYRERRRVETHLTHCLGCATQFRFETILLGLIRERLRRIDVPRDLLTNVLRRLAAEG